MAAVIKKVMRYFFQSIMYVRLSPGGLSGENGVVDSLDKPKGSDQGVDDQGVDQVHIPAIFHPGHSLPGEYDEKGQCDQKKIDEGNGLGVDEEPAEMKVAEAPVKADGMKPDSLFDHETKKAVIGHGHQIDRAEKGEKGQGQDKKAEIAVFSVED